MARDEAAARAAIREYLNGLGWSVQRLSDEAGVDYDTASAIQDPKSTRWPRRQNQLKIERALGLPEGMIERVALGEKLPAPRIPGSPASPSDGQAAPSPYGLAPFPDDSHILISYKLEEGDTRTDAEKREIVAAAELAIAKTLREQRSAR